MRATNYLCIDDQRDKQIQHLLDLLIVNGTLAIERRSPEALEAQIDEVSKASHRAEGMFGLLLDLRLDVEADADGKRVPYRGPTLAQELRTRMAEGALRSFPIILWSINQKFESSFSGDETSHDLFDAVYGKDEAVIKDSTRVQRELCALASGYEAIGGVSDVGAVASVLGRREMVDQPVYGEFFAACSEAAGRTSRHDLARLIMRTLVLRDGLLVDEGLVAARFGIDRDKSAGAWSAFLTIISAAKYGGPFADGWCRWWWYDLEDWWLTLRERQTNLRRLAASERVAILNDRFGLELRSANPIQDGYSDRFFAVCVATDRPLDPIDGLRVLTPGSRSWNEQRYVSVIAALERLNKNAWRLHPSDYARLDALKGGQ